MIDDLEQFEIEIPDDLDFYFKEINPDDFEGYNVKNNQKTIIDVCDRGYIYDSLINEIDLFEQNTLVINASVGQGKSYAVNRLAKSYYDNIDNANIVFLVVPFIDLINQYKNDLINLGVNPDDILDYREIKKIDQPNECFFHLITVNSLLGNFGDSAVSQNSLKRGYLSSLKNYCVKNNYQVIMFFDEIHDSIKNFKELFIFNLLKWRNITQKVYVSSATYNEASKTVIKYLSELTNYNIEIIESKRIRKENSQSRLHILYEEQFSFNSKNPRIQSVIKYELDKGNKPHILTATKSAAKEFSSATSMVAKMIKAKGFEINKCIGSNTNIFDEEFCNIGTTFKTGRSIKDEKSTLFIIFPTKSEDKNTTIFSDGINSILQSVARPRVNCDIYLITSFPSKLIKPINDSNNYIESLIDIRPSFYRNDCNEDYLYEYKSLLDQSSCLNDYYLENKREFDSHTSYLNYTGRSDKPRIEFPPKEIFNLDFGEKYLANKFPIYGSDISSYVTWAAFNNQFFNCKLKTVFSSEFEMFCENEIQVGLDVFFNDKFDNQSAFFELNSDLSCFKEIRTALFNKLVYYKKQGLENELFPKKIKITNNLKNKFNRHILSFIQRRKSSVNWYFRKVFYEGLNPVHNKINDYEFSVFDYVRASMAVSNNSDYQFLDDNQTIIKEQYSIIYNLKSDFKNNFCFEDVNNKNFLLKDVSLHKYNLFGDEMFSTLNSVINNLKEYDENLKMFSFFQNYKSTNVEASKKQIYSFFKKIFFITNRERINSDKFPLEDKADVIIKEFEFDRDSSLNLIYEPNDPWIYQSGHGFVDGNVID